MKRITIIILMMLMIGLVGAGITLTKDRDLTLRDNLDVFYSDKNIIISYEDMKQDGKYWRCLYSSTRFNLPCSLPFKGSEINETKLDEWEKSELENIASVYINRSLQSEPEVVTKGGITLK